MSGGRGRMAALVHERLTPLHSRGYRRIAAAMMATNLGNGAQFVANVWLVLQMLHTTRSVSLVLLTTAIPGVFFGPIIGVLIDRLPRRLVFAGSDMCSVTVLAATSVIYYTGHLRPWEVFVMVFLLALFESTSVPTGTTLVREIVPVNRLLAANATTGVAVQTGNVIGAAIGGVIIGASSVGAVLLLNMASFLVSAAFVVGVRTTRQIKRPGDGSWKASFKEAGRGLGYLRSHPKMLPTYGMLLALFATLYLLNTLLAPFADDVLRVGASGLGFIDAMFACGAIVGGVVLPLVTARVNRDRVAAVGVVGMGITLIALSRSVHLALPMLLYASAGICFQSFYIFRSRVQEQVPIALQGRVMSLLISSVGVCRLVVYGLLALFASDAALRSAYATAGAALLTLGVLVTVAAFRAKTASAPPEVEPELETDAGGTPDVAPPGTPAPPSLPEAPSDRTALAASVPAERS